MMRLISQLALAIAAGIGEIQTHAFRSILTVLGLILAVGAVVAMSGLTRGVEATLEERLKESGGLNRLQVVPAQPPASQQSRKELSPGLTLDDATAVRSLDDMVEWVSPVLNFGRARMAYGTERARANLVAAMEGFLKQDSHEVLHGRFITTLDLEQRNQVVVLGDSVAKRLFGPHTSDAIGKKIRLKQASFEVVGIFPRYVTDRDRRREEAGIMDAQRERRMERSGGRARGGWDPYYWKNQVVVIPLTTGMTLFRTVNLDNSQVDQGPNRLLDRLSVGLRDGVSLTEAMERVRSLLLITHRGIDDFNVVSEAARQEQMEEQLNTTRLNGLVISGIGLLVGGLGVTNIMLAGITDRIREIGIRKSLGARDQDIFLQVVIEAVLLALIGAIFGLLAGFGLVNLLAWLYPTETRVIIDPPILAFSCLFALATGLLAGLYPAWRASRLSPLGALRFE